MEQKKTAFNMLCSLHCILWMKFNPRLYTKEDFSVCVNSSFSGGWFSILLSYHSVRHDHKINDCFIGSSLLSMCNSNQCRVQLIEIVLCNRSQSNCTLNSCDFQKWTNRTSHTEKIYSEFSFIDTFGFCAVLIRFFNRFSQS